MRRVSHLFVVIVLSMLVSTVLYGQLWSNVLSSSRAINWSKAGLPGTLTYGTGGSACNGSSANCTETTANPWTQPTRTQCGSTINPSGNATTDTTNVNNALAACKPGTYVLLASGSFAFNGTIKLYTQNGVTLRGSGAQSTIVTLTNSAYIEFGAGYGNGLCGWTGGYSAGTTSITLSGCTSAPPVGALLTLSQCNTGMIGCGYNVGSGSTISLYTAAPGSQFQSNWAGNYDAYVCTGTAPTCTAYPITAVASGTSMTVTGTPTSNAYFYIAPSALADNNGLWVCGGLPLCQRSNEGGEATNLQSQVVIPTAITGSGTYTVTISPGLYMPNWSASNGPSANWSTGAHTVTALGNAIEDMTIYNNYNGASSSALLSNSYASWMKGVRFIGSGSYYSLIVSNAKNCLVMNNYFFSDPFGDGNYPEAVQEQQDSDDLILNNIMVSGEAWEGFGQMSGNVLAYNYGRDTFTAYPLDIFEHIPGNAYQLYEGNETGTINEDNTHGTHDLSTAFRNYVLGYDAPYAAQQNPAGISWNPWDRFTNAIGNVIGTSGILTTYQSETQADGGFIFSIGYGAGYTDTLALTTSMRWGNWDNVTNAVRWCGNSSSPGWSTTCNSTSEVPSGLASPNASLSNPVPSTTTLPPSFFLPTAAAPIGGTQLNWWKVCTNWATFPTSCASFQTQPFPTTGPDVTGGPYNGGYAYDIPAKLAWQSLPIDSTYQKAYSIASSSWSSGIETLTFGSAVLPNIEHLMGGFQLSGVASACNPSGGELLITNSSSTTVSYSLSSNPGTSCTGTMQFPDVRQFDERVYQTDSMPAVNSPTAASVSSVQ